jgi:hypothetical protein
MQSILNKSVQYAHTVFGLILQKEYIIIYPFETTVALQMKLAFCAHLEFNAETNKQRMSLTKLDSS